ncbi:hypothetical protein Q8A73_014756 [Channa argus]|nr:hypothetical protein Q8A73_014756 [Channa argus]
MVKDKAEDQTLQYQQTLDPECFIVCHRQDSEDFQTFACLDFGSTDTLMLQPDRADHMELIEKNRDLSDYFSRRKQHRNVIPSFTATLLAMQHRL